MQATGKSRGSAWTVGNGRKSRKTFATGRSYSELESLLRHAARNQSKVHEKRVPGQRPKEVTGGGSRRLDSANRGKGRGLQIRRKKNREVAGGKR